MAVDTRDTQSLGLGHFLDTQSSSHMWLGRRRRWLGRHRVAAVPGAPPELGASVVRAAGQLAAGNRWSSRADRTVSGSSIIGAWPDVASSMTVA